ncbi:MAG: hypothetical protein IJY63_00985 [Clostridia bacterium]|nr:hypothetical protein [Clostridia bacterium]
MKKARITMISLAAIAACACVSMGAKAIDVNAATTPTYATFKMQEGASVRVGNVKDENDVVIDSGLRFCAEISADEYNALIGVGAKFGMIIAASDQLGDVELNEKNVFEDPLVYYDGQENADASKIMVTNVRAEYADVDNDGAKEICGALTNIKESNLTRPFVGRAYVAIPSTMETVETEDGTTETVVTEYEYHFAPYYANDGYTEDDVQNNTRSVYYVAQKAVEAGDSRSNELKEDYINKLSTKNYKYIINYHYKDADTTETHLQTAKFALLNSTVTMDKETEYPDEITRTLADGTKKTYELAPVTNAGLARSGLVYATLLQEFHVYYMEKTASEEQNAQATLENMISDTTKAELYFDGKLAYNAETGELEATDRESWGGINPGQPNVIFTPAFLYQLQQAGAKYLRVKTIYATPTDLLGIKVTNTECVTVSGYYTSKKHFSNRDSSIETDGTIGALTTVDEKTYLTAGSDGYIYFDISKEIVENSNGTYTYKDGGATAQGITFTACSSTSWNSHASLSGREWIIKELAALTAEQVPTDEGLIIVQ